MSKEKEINPECKNNAKHLVDMLFDKKIFRKEITRDQMVIIEELIAFYIQSHIDTEVKGQMILNNFYKNANNNPN